MPFLAWKFKIKWDIFGDFFITVIDEKKVNCQEFQPKKIRKKCVKIEKNHKKWLDAVFNFFLDFDTFFSIFLWFWLKPLKFFFLLNHSDLKSQNVLKFQKRHLTIFCNFFLYTPKTTLKTFVKYHVGGFWVVSNTKGRIIFTLLLHI